MITIPNGYDHDESALVDAFNALPYEQQDHRYWGDEALSSLRHRAKAHYIATQNSRCCYCQQIVPTQNQRVWDLEHIVPRSTHPQFMFEPRNLAASCPDCNIRKGEQQTLVNPARRTYPTDSESFNIYHPHFDDFDDHLYWNGSYVYMPRTDKGRKTIYVCDLLRFAQQFLHLPASLADTRFEQSVSDLMSLEPGRSQAALNEIRGTIDAGVADASTSESPRPDASSTDITDENARGDRPGMS